MVTRFWAMRPVGSVARFLWYRGGVSDEREDEGKPLVSGDPLHDTDGFAKRHLIRGLLILVALAFLIYTGGFIDCD